MFYKTGLLLQLQAAQYTLTHAQCLQLSLEPTAFFFFLEREYDFPLLPINDCSVVLYWEWGDIRRKQPGVK